MWTTIQRLQYISAPASLINQNHAAVSVAAVPFISHFPIPSPSAPADLPRSSGSRALLRISKPSSGVGALRAHSRVRQRGRGFFASGILVCILCFLLRLPLKESRSLAVPVRDNQRKGRRAGNLHARRRGVFTCTMQRCHPERLRCCRVAVLPADSSDGISSVCLPRNLPSRRGRAATTEQIRR